MIILLGGRLHSGKTTVAECIYNKLFNAGDGATLLHLATPLKQAALDLGWNGEKDEKGRRFLQELGDCIRNYDEDLLCKMLHYDVSTAISKGKTVIIDDVRYLNELQYFKREFKPDTDVETIFVYRKTGVPESSHQSERLAKEAFDTATDNEHFTPSQTADNILHYLGIVL